MHSDDMQESGAKEHKVTFSPAVVEKTERETGNGTGKGGITRVQSCPNSFPADQSHDDEYDSFANMKYSTFDLPDVFEDEDEFDEECSPVLSPRSRHDSGIQMQNRRQTKQRQRYNSSSIRRTPVSAGYINELIERRGSLKSEPDGPDRDKHIVTSSLKYITDPLNVLVIGPQNSGKTTLINSLLMSVTREWADRAQYGVGRNHTLAPVVLYENPDHHKRTRTMSDSRGRHQAHTRHRHFDPTWKRAHDDPCGRVVFWDTRGFHDIHDDHHQALLLRYILEGRLHPQNLSQALLLPDEVCKKRYRNAIKDNQIDLILYVSAADDEPDRKLFRAMRRAKEESKDEKTKSNPRTP
jgi:GTPase SAR1 family protein